MGVLSADGGVQLEDLAKWALARAEGHGATYADVRVEEVTREVLAVHNAAFRNGGQSISRGMNVRVLVDGAWGFSAAAGWTTEAAGAAADEAVEIARASARVQGEPVQLAPRQAVVDRYRTPIEEDPFAVETEEKMALLLDCDARMRRYDVVGRLGRLEFVRKEKYFASSEGDSIHQAITYSGAGIAAVAAGGGDSQIRSYPHCWANGGQFATRGYELVRELDLPGASEQTASEAVQLLQAEPCPSGMLDIVVDPTQLALMVHECCGHPVELDRVLGSEASLAGTSFLTPDMLGSYRYGSEVVNLTADATLPGGLGTFGYDDEGVRGARTPLVRGGIFNGYLTSRETASRLGQASNGTMRADSWKHLPLVRMTNINLEPGQGGLRDLLADTSGGLFMSTIRSWSIDDRRLNFQFGPEVAWEIAGGKLGKMYKNPTFSGITPGLWRSCDWVCGPREWNLWGFPTCGKGHPSQSGQVAHGTAPARFRGVKVGDV